MYFRESNDVVEWTWLDAICPVMQVCVLAAPDYIYCTAILQGIFVTIYPHIRFWTWYPNKLKMQDGAQDVKNTSSDAG
jgi:hypothetical protein